MNVTCYSRGSSPPAELAWKVNDDKVLEEDKMVFYVDHHQLFQIYDERSSGEVSGAPVMSDEKFDSYQYLYDNRAGSYTLLQPKVRCDALSSSGS